MLGSAKRLRSVQCHIATDLFWALGGYWHGSLLGPWQRHSVTDGLKERFGSKRFTCTCKLAKFSVPDPLPGSDCTISWKFDFFNCSSNRGRAVSEVELQDASTCTLSASIKYFRSIRGFFCSNTEEISRESVETAL